jgi:hypothetical protein
MKEVFKKLDEVISREQYLHDIDLIFSIQSLVIY